MTTVDRSERLKALLEQAFQPTQLDIRDDSRSHAGHQHGGGGHYSAAICSSHFAGRSGVERHRMVYTVVGAMIPHEIHALSIRAVTPEELAAA